jgi:hypothetical protein
MLVLISSAALALAQSTPRPATPVEPIGGILDAFKTHSIVVLGDEHGSEHRARVPSQADSRPPVFFGRE